MEPNIARLNDLLAKFVGTRDGPGGWRCRRRNLIYLQLDSFIVRWLRPALHDKDIELSEGELVSLSWDAFEFALRAYENHVEGRGNNVKAKAFTTLGHFYRYTLIYVKRYLAERMQRPVTIGIEDINLEDMPYDGLFDLKKFKASLPAKYQDICVDIITGRDIGPSNKYKAIKYNEARKVLKHVMAFFLRENGEL